MTIVTPPYILDFAKSTLDRRADFSAEVLEEWRARVEDEFEERWPRAMAIYSELRDLYGIYHEDISPRNVDFGDAAESDK